VQVAILVVGVIAALAAVAAVVVPLLRQRERLDLTFLDGFGSSPYVISLPCRVENRGRSPIYNIDLFGGPPGITLDRPPIDTVTLQPGMHYGFWIELGRPDVADVEPGDTTPILKTPQLIAARSGRRLTVTEMPAGPYDPARAKTKTHRRRESFEAR
jgi:hypothetical protein